MLVLFPVVDRLVVVAAKVKTVAFCVMVEAVVVVNLVLGAAVAALETVAIACAVSSIALVVKVRIERV